MDSNQDIIRFLSLLDERIGHLDTVKLISNVLRFITKQLKLKRASVAILKPDHSGFIIRDVTFDIKEMETERLLPFTSTPQSLCIQDLKPLYRPDIKKSKPAFEVDAKLLASGLKSDFLVPLIIGDKCLGTLNSGSEKVNGISEYKRKLLILIAPKFAQALQNAKLHEELLESEKRFRSFLNAMDDLVFVLDTDNRFVSYYAPEELLLEKPHTFLGKKHDEVMPPDVNIKFNIALAKIKQGQSSEYNYHLEMPDGKHWYSTKLSLIFEKGEYAGLIAVSRDITEHKEAEEELRQHREHLEELVKVRTADLEEKNIELARFNKLFVGREFRIKELRDEIMELEKRLHHK